MNLFCCPLSESCCVLIDHHKCYSQTHLFPSIDILVASQYQVRLQFSKRACVCFFKAMDPI